VQLEGFNADVAHELRTPLANLIGQTELALSRERSAPSSPTCWPPTSKNCSAWRASSTTCCSWRRPTAASRPGGAARQSGRAGAPGGRVPRGADGRGRPGHRHRGRCELAVDEPLIKRALSNLLGNAIRYAEKGSRLCVRILSPRATAGAAVGGKRGTVHRTRPPAPPVRPLLPRRCIALRARKPHHGLGLSIVAAIARMHDGLASAESANGRTRVGFSLHSEPPLRCS
jgi:two-component system, OmpR family, heavy metal sensor histidine kinase CusS